MRETGRKVRTHDSLTDCSHGHLHNRKGTCTDRHGTKQRRQDSLPKTSHATGMPRCSNAATHRGVSLLRTEAIRLHLALDDVKGVAGQPENLASKATVKGDFPRWNLLALDSVTRGVCVHQVLKGREPGTVCAGLAIKRDDGAAVEASQETLVRAQLANTVERSVIEARIAVGLTLEPDADMLDGRGQCGISHASKGTSREILSMGEIGAVRRENRGARAGSAGVTVFKPPPCGVKGPELNRHAGPDAEQRRQRSLVEG